jgi:hypothetical protein
MSERVHKKNKADEFLTPPLKTPHEGRPTLGGPELQGWISLVLSLPIKERTFDVEQWGVLFDMHLFITVLNIHSR